MMMRLRLTGSYVDEGSVMVAGAVTEDGDSIAVVGDRRQMIEALEAHANSDEPVYVLAEAWQLMGGTREAV